MTHSSESPKADGLRALEAAQETLGEALRASMSAGHTPEALMTIASSPWEEIRRVAEDHGCEGLLLGRNDLDGVAGGPLEELMNDVPCDVAFLIAPSGWRLERAARILVAVGGRDAHRTMRARLLGSLCRAAPRSVTWLRILPSKASDSQVSDAERDLRAIAEDETPGGASVAVVRSDDVVQALAERSRDADLIVAGLERSPGGRRAFGTVLPKMVARTNCATILISRR